MQTLKCDILLFINYEHVLIQLTVPQKKWKQNICRQQRKTYIPEYFLQKNKTFTRYIIQVVYHK